MTRQERLKEVVRPTRAIDRKLNRKLVMIKKQLKKSDGDSVDYESRVEERDPKPDFKVVDPHKTREDSSSVDSVESL